MHALYTRTRVNFYYMQEIINNFLLIRIDRSEENETTPFSCNLLVTRAADKHDFELNLQSEQWTILQLTFRDRKLTN